MKTARVLAACMVCLLAFFLVTTGALAKSGQDVVEKKCVTCHSLKRVCMGLDLKDKKDWAAVIDRMIQKRGARLTPQERALAYGYLILQTSKTAPFCK